MWVMLDIVPNHSGYFAEEDIEEMTFDKPEYYHSCDGEHVNQFPIELLDRGLSIEQHILCNWHTT